MLLQKPYFTSVPVDSFNLQQNKKIRHLGLKCVEENRPCLFMLSFRRILITHINEILLRMKLFQFHLVGVPLQKICIFHAWNYFFFLSLSKSAHTFVLCPTHFPLSFFMPTPPPPPPIASLPPRPFPLCLSTWRLKRGTYHMSHSLLTATPFAQCGMVRSCFA